MENNKGLVIPKNIMKHCHIFNIIGEKKLNFIKFSCQCCNNWCCLKEKTRMSEINNIKLNSFLCYLSILLKNYEEYYNSFLEIFDAKDNNKALNYLWEDFYNMFDSFFINNLWVEYYKHSKYIQQIVIKINQTSHIYKCDISDISFPIFILHYRLKYLFKGGYDPYLGQKNNELNDVLVSPIYASMFSKIRIFKNRGFKIVNKKNIDIGSFKFGFNKYNHTFDAVSMVCNLVWLPVPPDDNKKSIDNHINNFSKKRILCKYGKQCNFRIKFNNFNNNNYCKKEHYCVIKNCKLGNKCFFDHKH